MTLKKPLPLNAEEIRKVIHEQLDRLSSRKASTYGIFYNDKLVIVSKSIVYLHEGRAKAELLRMFRHSLYYNGTYHHEFDRNVAKEYIKSLLRDKTLEIRKL